MTERVEEIRRRHEKEIESPLLGDNKHYDEIECLLTALAQAERTIGELDRLKNDAILRFDDLDRYSADQEEELHRVQIALAQAEREREELAAMNAAQAAIIRNQRAALEGRR